LDDIEENSTPSFVVSRTRPKLPPTFKPTYQPPQTSTGGRGRRLEFHIGGAGHVDRGEGGECAHCQEKLSHWAFPAGASDAVATKACIGKFSKKEGKFCVPSATFRKNNSV
jgi:hypothetical protein